MEVLHQAVHATIERAPCARQQFFIGLCLLEIQWFVVVERCVGRSYGEDGTYVECPTCFKHVPADGPMVTSQWIDRWVRGIKAS
eukprot:1109910-Amphidinium_carterae.1